MLEDIIRERKIKRQNIASKLKTAYPARAFKSHNVGDILGSWQKLKKIKKLPTLAGRVLGLRRQGGVIFFDLEDSSGKIQGVIKKDDFIEFDFVKDNLDIGDFITIAGAPFVTKAGQKSIAVERLVFLAKSIRPIPSEFYGLKDPETRFRKRYLDLLLDREARKLFAKKAIFWATIRDFLVEQNYLEVQTPVLEATPGGAEAEPFSTHHNALNEDFYLRISLELPLKRLLVAGFERVFEIGRIFRNEGLSAEHLQDYTQMEMYGAYEDYHSLMKLTERLYRKIVKALTGKLATTRDANKIDWGGKWQIYDYYELLKKHGGVELASISDGELLNKAKSLKLVGLKPGMGRGRLIDLIFKNAVRPKLIQPGFLINPPVEIEPLAKRLESDPSRVERFQIVAGGTELGKGFSELNDPIDQRERFEAQMELRAAGDKEAQMIDEDYLEAMEYGMPPTGGFGLSERLFSFIMDLPIRETTLFPLMRKKQ